MSVATANSLKEAAEKIKFSLGNAVNFCVTSHRVEEKLIRESDDKGGPGIFFFGIQIIPAIEIESEHGFFFGTYQDAEDFLEEVRKLKKMGLSWQAILGYFEFQMKQKGERI